MFNQRTRSLVLVCALTLLALMNYTAPFAALVDTAAGLHAGVSSQTWVLSGISLGLAATLLGAGGLADNHGRKRILVAGTGFFAAASVLCAAADDALVFTIGRILQGAGSAAILAAGLGLLGSVYPAGPARARASALWGAMLGLGIAAGPIVAAELTTAASWRWPYALYAALALVLAALTVALVQESTGPARRKPDPAGAIVLGIGLGALIAALIEGRPGWGAPEPILLAAVSVAALIGFVVIEHRLAEPMLDLSLFARPRFVAATAGAFFTGMSVIAVMSFLPTPLGVLFGLSSLGGAFVIAIWSAMSFLVALGGRAIAQRIGNPRQLVTGLVVTGVGVLAMSGSPGAWEWFIPGLVICGVGSGLLNAALGGLAIDAVPPQLASMGSAATNAARYVGASIGVTLVVTIATGSGRVSSSGTNAAVLLTGALAFAGAALTWWALRRERVRPVLVPEAFADDREPVRAE